MCVVWGSQDRGSLLPRDGLRNDAVMSNLLSSPQTPGGTAALAVPPPSLFHLAIVFETLSNSCRVTGFEKTGREALHVPFYKKSYKICLLRLLHIQVRNSTAEPAETRSTKHSMRLPAPSVGMSPPLPEVDLRRRRVRQEQVKEDTRITRADQESRTWATCGVSRRSSTG